MRPAGVNSPPHFNIKTRDGSDGASTLYGKRKIGYVRYLFLEISYLELFRKYMYLVGVLKICLHLYYYGIKLLYNYKTILNIVGLIPKFAPKCFFFNW